MSGGGSGGGVSRGGTGDEDTKCQTIYKGASLASPKRDVLQELSVGDVLELEVAQQGTSYILFAVSSGKGAGSVTHSLLTQIIRCIEEEGHVYVARIQLLEGGNVSLEIRMSN